jgi:hypothetical protein
VPWLVQGFSRNSNWQVWVSAALLALLYFSWERRIHLDRLSGIGLDVVRFLYYRGDALLVVLLACVLLSAMYTTRDQKIGEV